MWLCHQVHRAHRRSLTQNKEVRIHWCEVIGLIALNNEILRWHSCVMLRDRCTRMEGWGGNEGSAITKEFLSHDDDWSADIDSIDLWSSVQYPTDWPMEQNHPSKKQAYKNNSANFYRLGTSQLSRNLIFLQFWRIKIQTVDKFRFKYVCFQVNWDL